MKADSGGATRIGRPGGAGAGGDAAGDGLGEFFDGEKAEVKKEGAGDGSAGAGGDAAAVRATVLGEDAELLGALADEGGYGAGADDGGHGAPGAAGPGADAEAAAEDEAPDAWPPRFEDSLMPPVTLPYHVAARDEDFAEDADVRAAERFALASRAAAAASAAAAAGSGSAADMATDESGAGAGAGAGPSSGSTLLRSSSATAPAAAATGPAILTGEPRFTVAAQHFVDAAGLRDYMAGGGYGAAVSAAEADIAGEEEAAMRALEEAGTYDADPEEAAEAIEAIMAAIGSGSGTSGSSSSSMIAADAAAAAAALAAREADRRIRVVAAHKLPTQEGRMMHLQMPSALPFLQRFAHAQLGRGNVPPAAGAGAGGAGAGAGAGSGFGAAAMGGAGLAYGGALDEEEAAAVGDPSRKFTGRAANLPTGSVGQVSRDGRDACAAASPHRN